MIKIATLEDYETIKSMADKFIEVSGYKEYSSDEDIRTTILNMLSAPRTASVIALGDGGMLAGAVSKFPFGPHFIATEVAWWVDPDKRKNGLGKELLRYFEIWAGVVGCSFVSMVSLDDELIKFYEKEGYKLYERACMKKL